MKVLAINPGSTSTKVAVYDELEEVFVETLDHPVDEIQKFDHIQDQFDFRKEVILSCMEKNHVKVEDLSAIVGRGGILPPVKSGAYRVNQTMVDRLKYKPVVEHASNLGALIAYEMATPLNIPAFIYDSVAVDELTDIARISGIPQIDRISLVHALNSRAMAYKVAEKYGKKYEEMNFVVAHLGGGISLSAHEKGQMIDIVSDDEGPFSPERAGRVPCSALIDLCFSGDYDKKTMKKIMRGQGGFGAYLGTKDARDVEKRIVEGDKEAELVYQAMSYQIAKGVGEMATVLKGDIDAIIITGGIAYSKLMTQWIEERVSFIGKVEIMAGENELESLAYGALRVLKGQEEARTYTEN